MEQGQAQQPAPANDAKDVEENKAMAAISYIGILVLIPLLAKKDSPYAQFHAKQGLVLFICGIILGVLGVIPIINIIAFIGYIVMIVLAIMGIINAVKGERKELPLIGGYAKKMNM